jgi:predicted GH43/DUF377 family glycosyl hydrolase
VRRIFTKYEGNPVISPEMMPAEVLYTFNPGAIQHKDQTILIMDVTTIDDIHRLWIARSEDGIHFSPDRQPLLMPPRDPYHLEMNTYDPRITKLGDDYFILYASDLDQNEVRIGILKTQDFTSFERVCTASEFGNRNGALFSEKIDSLYTRLDRPFGDEKRPCSMWVSQSPDLVFWGKSRPLTYRGKVFTDGFKMGAGAVPIKTDKGWLEIYHTVSCTCNGFIYRLKAMLLDLKDPSVILGYTRDFLLYPEHEYEMQGRVMNVIFTCNAILDPDRTVRVYYGAADTVIGLATAGLDDILSACMRFED